MKDLLSIIVPSYNTPKNYLITLYDSLVEQTYKNFEVVVVDDCSTYNFYDEVLKDDRFRVVYKDENSGPAKSRNIGVEEAKSDYIFFTDSDCELEADTLEKVMEKLPFEDAIMGDTITKTKSYFGKSVAYLGFPGGGILGFDRVWRVNEEGYTNSISSCNLAIKRDVFNAVGRFDTSFPVPGGEDTVFAKVLVKNGYKIKFSSEQIIYHVERGDLKGFIRWQKTRGIGNYYIRKKLGKVNSFLKLRLWSIKNSLMSAGLTHGILVALLWFLSVLYQTIGYQQEKKRVRS